MKNLKEERGITLIALIITIIVMIILVGVTISVAMNGGLIEKAGTAKSAQEEAIIKEQLEELILGKMDTNLRIPTDLQTIKIGEDTYTVIATEGTGENAGDIVLTLTAGDKTLPQYTVAGDLKIKGISLEVEIENPWITRGLTSVNIKYDKTYICEDFAMAELQGHAEVSINSDGSLTDSWDEGGTLSNETINSMLYPTEGEATIRIENGNTIISLLGGNTGIAFVGTDETTFIAYQGPWGSEVSQGSVVGIFTLQQ